MKNDGLLPLPASPGRIAVIGPSFKVAPILAGGLAQLNPHYSVSPWDALLARIGSDALTFAAGCTNHRWETVIAGDFTADYFS